MPESVRSRGDGGDDGTERRRAKPGRARSWHRRPHHRHPLIERFPMPKRSTLGPTRRTVGGLEPDARTRSSGTAIPPGAACASMPPGASSTSCSRGNRPEAGGARAGRRQDRRGTPMRGGGDRPHPAGRGPKPPVRAPEAAPGANRLEAGGITTSVSPVMSCSQAPSALTGCYGVVARSGPRSRRQLPAAVSARARAHRSSANFGRRAPAVNANVLGAPLERGAAAGVAILTSFNEPLPRQ